MPIAVGIIADDYTGASDVANVLAKSGLRTVQTIGIPGRDLVLPDVDAIVVSLKIRSVEASRAVAGACDADRWLRARGARHVMYKICSTFDSTDAGNIGAVTEALREDHGEAVALVTPAYPEMGRTVFRGHLFVGDMPLHESPLKDHPLNPMRDSNLVRVLQRQSKAGVGLLGLDVISRGPAAILARLTELGASGAVACIADAVSECHLDVLGEVAFGYPVSIGASGLGLGVARAAVTLGAVKVTKAVRGRGPSVGGLAAAVAGSCSRTTLEQIADAEKIMPVRRLDAARLLSDEAPSEIADAIAWASERIAAGPVLIASSAPPDEVARLQSRHGREKVGGAIEQASALIAERLVDFGVRRLVVAGGETSGAAVDRLGIPAFLVEDEISVGVPILRSVGWRADVRLALKSGNFGGHDFFDRALGMLF